MTEERKIVVPVEVDGTGSKAGFADVKQGAADMAQAVGKSAQDAGKAIDGIGASTERLNATQSRVLESIKRTTIGTVEGKAALLEYKAGLAGVSDAASPYIAKLKLAEQGQAQLGMSAKATAAALRGVPAQFTDIITSLQGGQKPITVLLQQGGQLKDMFGGIGGAARALGGYVVGLINPFTLAAGAVGVIAYALNEGSSEMRAFTNAATITGNAIGVSASQFAALRDSIGGIATKGKAAEVLTEIAANGKIAGSEIRGIAEAAILMEKATGQAVSKTIGQFADLAKTPVEAAMKLNEQYNFLTTAVFKQIKALEDQGRAVQAAELAERSFAEALKSRATTVLESAGIIEKAWRGITGAAKTAWDTMLGIGRSSTLSEKAGAAAADVARIQAQLQGVGAFGSTGGGAATGGASAARRAALEQELAGAKQVLAEATRRAEIEARNTAEKAEQNRLAQLGISFTKQSDEFLTKAQRMERELTKARVEGQELVAAGIIKQSELTQRLNNIREKYKESGAAGTGQNEVAAVAAKVKAAQEELTRLMSGAPTQKMTEGERLVIKTQEELKTSISGVARAEKEKLLVQAQALASIDKQIATETAYQKAMKESEATLDKQVDAVRKRADSAREQAVQQEAINANFGKSKTAVEQATLAELKNQQAMAQATDIFLPAYVAALNDEVEAQERKVKALQQAEYLQTSRSLQEAGRALGEETKLLELQVSLLGETQLNREKIIGQRKVEIELAKKLAEIDKLNLGTTPEAEAEREKLRAQARANAVIEGNNVASKAVLDEWQRTADSINQSLTDALLRGFESGKGFAENLRDTLVNMFKTLVLRPIIQAVLAPVSGSISQAVSSLTGAGGAGGIPSIPGIPGLNGSGSLAGLGSLATIAAASSFMATALGKILGLSEKGMQIAAVSGALLGGIPGAILGKIFGSGGGPKTEGGYAPTGLSIAGKDIGGNLQGSQRGDVAAAQELSKGISDSYAALAKQLGLVQQKLDVGVFYSMDNAKGGTSLTQLQLTSSAGYDRGARLGGIENVARGEDALKAALAEETTRLLVDALKQSDLAQQYKDILNALTADASEQVLKDAIDRIATAKQQQQQLEATLFDLTATDTEKLAKARDDERKAIDPLNAALLEQVYAQQDLAKATEAATAAAQARAANLQTYEQNFLSPEEQRRKTAAGIAKSLKDSIGLDIGIDQVLGTSREQFRAFVDTLDDTTAEGAKVKDAMLAVAGSLASITDKAAAAAEAVTNYGETFANAGDLALAAGTAAAEQMAAAQAVRDAWKLTFQSIEDSIKQLRGELTGNKAATFAGAQSQFAIATAQARAGDKAAADSLPALAKTVQELALGQASTRVDYARIVAATIASLEFTNGTIRPRAGLPAFGDGTPEVMQTGQAVIHQGEAILPPAVAQRWRDGSGNQELVAEVRALRAEVSELRKSADSTARSSDRADKVLQGWDRAGVPVINQPDTVLA